MANEPVSFEAALDGLSQTVKKLEGGDLPLEESLRLFEQGVALSQRCQEHLSNAEQKVEILLKNAAGQSELQSFPPGRT